jgi:hypothetical protein
MSYEALKFGNFGWSHMHAWVDPGPGHKWRECALRDLTNRSARLSVIGPLPDHFVLHLTETGSLARECKVVARDLGAVSVEFTW